MYIIQLTSLLNQSTIKELRNLSMCLVLSKMSDCRKKLIYKCCFLFLVLNVLHQVIKKDKGSPYSITERRVPELIPVLGSQSAGDVNHKPYGRLPLLSARPVVAPATLKRAATNFAAW